jgi:vacuolar-type H+-ATPase subunit C/Vma6
VAAAALGRVIDALPPEPVEAAALEARGEDRLARLAARALRRGPLGLGTVIGYLGLRRVEVANLVTLSEALRAGLPEDQVRARMIG